MKSTISTKLPPAKEIMLGRGVLIWELATLKISMKKLQDYWAWLTRIKLPKKNRIKRWKEVVTMNLELDRRLLLLTRTMIKSKIWVTSPTMPQEKSIWIKNQNYINTQTQKLRIFRERRLCQHFKQAKLLHKRVKSQT